MKLHDYLKSNKASNLAQSVGVHPVLISQWSNGSRSVPVERCIAIESATNGQVTVEELRPDLIEHWSYIRGTSKRQNTEAAA